MLLPFTKLLPGGNPTILLPGEALPKGSLPAVAAHLMHPLHLGAEQVGALFTETGTPHLEMMGGEFCVNASRAAAFLLAGRGAFFEIAENIRGGLLSVSGLDAPAAAVVASDRRALDAWLSRGLELPTNAPCSPLAGQTLFCAVRVAVPAAATESCSPGKTLVRLPGICHLLLDSRLHPLPHDPFAEAERERRELGLDNEPAAGVIWCSESIAGPAITPVVWVAATNSTHLETACGSASLALALTRQASTSVIQPSAEALDITLCAGHAWVSGRVDLIAQGDTWVQDYSKSCD